MRVLLVRSGVLNVEYTCVYTLHSFALCISFSDTTDLCAVSRSFGSFYELADLITDLELAASAVQVYELLIAL